jgi:hypothetical protein
VPVLKVFDWLGRKEEPREDVFLPAFFICPIRKTPDAETKRRSSAFFSSGQLLSSGAGAEEHSGAGASPRFPGLAVKGSRRTIATEEVNKVVCERTNLLALQALDSMIVFHFAAGQLGLTLLSVD